LDESAAGAIFSALASRGNTEPGAARAAVDHVPDGGTLVVSSSMPVRDIEWYSEPRDGIRVLANRGANGIDGVLSTAVGVALTGVSTVCLLGDLAFLHDQNALIEIDQRAVDLRVIVVNNRGGGIFSFLPQHDELSHRQYERLFGTPQHSSAFLFAETGPLDLFVFAETDREENVKVHAAIHDAIAAAVLRAG
jgi:2-succinyl-5-enolpyruvyl-6-hydroxy-3-cyclohexene-1-carboxylate synthase